MKRVAFLASFVALSATAGSIATATSSDGASITLMEEAGPCVGGARLAVYVSPDAKSRVPGCWKLAGGMVVVAFLDGDMAQIPVGDLKKPTSL